MTKKNTVESFKFKGIISGTSNKQGGDFVSDKPRKTCYIKVDKHNEKILLENGLTKYTSKENKEDFFIIKASEIISIWHKGKCTEKDTSTSSENFASDVEISMACIKGKSMGKNYVRLYAIGIERAIDIVDLEKENPFADEQEIEGFHPTDEDIPF